MRSLETPQWAADVLEAFLGATDPAVAGGEFGRALAAHPRTGLPELSGSPRWRSHLAVAGVGWFGGSGGEKTGRLRDVVWGARETCEDPRIFAPVLLMQDPDFDQAATLRRAFDALTGPVQAGKWDFRTSRNPSLSASSEGVWLHDGRRFRQKARAGFASSPLFSSGLKSKGRLLLESALSRSADFLADGFEALLHAGEADLARMSAHERLEAVSEIEATRSGLPAGIRKGLDPLFGDAISKTFGRAAAGSVRMERSEGSLRAILSLRSWDGSHVDIDMLGRVPAP